MLTKFPDSPGRALFFSRKMNENTGFGHRPGICMTTRAFMGKFRMIP